MSVKIENILKRIISIRLNSGSMLHLSPGTISEEFPDSDVINNHKIQQLENSHYIILHWTGKEDKPKGGIGERNKKRKQPKVKPGEDKKPEAKEQIKKEPPEELDLNLSKP